MVMAGYVLCFGDYRGFRLILNYHQLLSLLTLQTQSQICNSFIDSAKEVRIYTLIYFLINPKCVICAKCTSIQC